VVSKLCNMKNRGGEGRSRGREREFLCRCCPYCVSVCISTSKYCKSAALVYLGPSALAYTPGTSFDHYFETKVLLVAAIAVVLTSLLLQSEGIVK